MDSSGRLHAASIEQAIRRGLMPVVPSSKQTVRMRIGRNDPCPCGSGRKFKHCHLRKKPVALQEQSPAFQDAMERRKSS